MWSFARQQKHNFCPRAFYFQYREVEKAGLSPELHNEVLDIRQTNYLQKSQKYLLAQLIKEVFYSRPPSLYDVKKLIFKEAKKLDLSDVQIEDTFEALSSFFESEFYRETNPSLVNHILVEEYTSFQVSDVTILGAVHLAWTSEQGKFNILKIVRSVKYPENSFAALYAMKKYQVSPENLNVGFLSTSDWVCTWNAIDWHDVSELQEKALSFQDSDDFAEYSPTEHISRCEVCEYGELCYKNSRELESI